MGLYYQIRALIYIFAISLMSICYLVFTQDDYKLETKNAQADKAFLKWKLSSSESKMPELLRGTLNTKAELDYLANQSQIFFSEQTSASDIDKKIELVTQNFLNRFVSKNTRSKVYPELKNLVNILIRPEIEVFLNNSQNNSQKKENPSYKKLLNSLSRIKTPVGTTLKDWAIRYLTSESILAALPIIDKLKIENKHFDLLPKQEKESILKEVSLIVTKLFIKTLTDLKNKFNFDIPENLFQEIENKIFLFLQKKLSV